MLCNYHESMWVKDFIFENLVPLPIFFFPSFFTDRKTMDFPASHLNVDRVSVNLLHRKLTDNNDVRLTFAMKGEVFYQIFSENCCTFQMIGLFTSWVWVLDYDSPPNFSEHDTDYSPTCLGQTWIPWTHSISPAESLFISFQNLHFLWTSSKIQHGFFELFTIAH